MKQAAYVGRVEAALSSARLGPYSASAGKARWESLARYAWNVSLCEAFYPLLHHVEVVLRNRLDDLGRTAYPYHRVRHISCSLDSDPSPLTQYGLEDVLKAKKKLFGVDRANGGLLPPRRSYSAGDLIAALDFGFWTGLFNKHYFFQNARDKRLWPHGLRSVFPHGPRKLHFGEVSGRLNEIRQLRNRVFHHEPIWRRADLAGERDGVLELLDWMSPEVARTLRATERLTEVMSDDFRRRLRVRIYREARR